MLLNVSNGGVIRMIYSDDLACLLGEGVGSINRASHVEPGIGGWFADLSPVKGPNLGPFALRADALAAEVNWLELNYISGTDPVSVDTLNMLLSLTDPFNGPTDPFARSLSLPPMTASEIERFNEELDSAEYDPTVQIEDYV
jgi:hypothetical protein